MASVLRGDAELAALLSVYRGVPAVFTTDPPPGDARLPYIMTTGEVACTADDTKTGCGRVVMRDVRCYAEADGSAVTVEAMAERVRQLFHRRPPAVDGYQVLVAECSGPVVADEPDCYGRVVTVRLTMREV